MRAGITLAATGLVPASPIALDPDDALDVACSVEMLHEASLMHDDICDGSATRRGAPSVAARYGIRLAAVAGLHMAGVSLRLLAEVLERYPEVLARMPATLADATYIHNLGDLSAGQIVETLPPTADPDSLRRHYRTVAAAKTGTLFRVGCSYGGLMGGCDRAQLRALNAYADHLAIAFQIMDDIRDCEGSPSLGKQAGTDLDRLIPTWPVIEWLGLLPGAYERWRAAAEGRLPASALAGLCQDVVATGATAKAHAVATAEVGAAVGVLAAFPETPGRRFLADLGERVLQR